MRGRQTFVGAIFGHRGRGNGARSLGKVPHHFLKAGIGGLEFSHFFKNNVVCFWRWLCDVAWRIELRLEIGLDLEMGAWVIALLEWPIRVGWILEMFS